MIRNENIITENLKGFLDDIVQRVNNLDFIELDPIRVPHSYSSQQDIEISGFFSAIFAWGNRKTIINKSVELMKMMDDRPYEFIKYHSESERKSFLKFKHRTFQAIDILYFIEFLQQHYQKYDTLEVAFNPPGINHYSQEIALINFYNYFFESEFAPDRTRKHIASPEKHSTCKRLNMYLRWMVRSDTQKVDFGIWKTIPMSGLMMPLDVHVEKYARQLNFISRKQRDWLTVVELTETLKKFDPDDPVKYDFALFGLGFIKDDYS
ncbi:MAG: TIGR02757 family protein [Saprospiraceae bacterium]|nr:TIGR02757 family protein [Saprospiraceae bacterium]